MSENGVIFQTHAELSGRNNVTMMFRDRADAGRQLAVALEFLRGRDDVLVLGIPRGGMVVAFEVALALHAKLDAWFAHKIGAPQNPEFAIGSIDESGVLQIDEPLLRMLNVSQTYLESEAASQLAGISRRAARYRENRAPLSVMEKTVVLVDDGLATGSTARAALKSLRPQNPARLILAVPVAPPEICTQLAALADQIVVLQTPATFGAVGQFYDVFGQTSDEEVIALLRRAEQNADS